MEEQTLELNKALEIPEGESESDETEPETPVELPEQPELPEARESFMFETPGGYKIASQSCSLRADILANLCLGVYSELSKSNGNKKEASYTG